MSKKIIAVVGSTGAQGSSVVRALLANGSYHVRALTRNANSDKAKNLATLNNCTVVEADLNNAESLVAAFQGCYGVFLVTETFIGPIEIQHGKNAIDSAIACVVSHFVFSGLESVKKNFHKSCDHFDFKAVIEEYGLEKAQAGKIIFTSLRLPGYYENFITFLIKKVKPNEYVVNLPLEGKPMFVISVDDLGECVLSVFQNPSEYKSQLIGLATENLTCDECVAILNKHLAPNKFVDIQLTLKQYESFGFPGVQEMVAMFEFVQSGKLYRDIALTKKLNKNLLTFEQWVVKNKEDILNKI